MLGPLTWSELVVTLRPGNEGDAVRRRRRCSTTTAPPWRWTARSVHATRAAVITFEQANGLHVDGIVDDEVWKHLLAQSAE